MKASIQRRAELLAVRCGRFYRDMVEARRKSSRSPRAGARGSGRSSRRLGLTGLPFSADYGGFGTARWTRGAPPPPPPPPPPYGSLRRGAVVEPYLANIMGARSLGASGSAENRSGHPAGRRRSRMKSPSRTRRTRRKLGVVGAPDRDKLVFLRQPPLFHRSRGRQNETVPHHGQHVCAD